MFFLSRLSPLGDAALLVPAAIMLAAYLLVTGRRGTAASFVVAVGSCWVVTFALKLLFRACGGALTSLDVISPSGHASFATLFYGVVAILICAGRPRPLQLAVAALTAALLVGISVSRVTTGAHSLAEVVIGLVIGGAALALFGLTARARILRPIPIWHLAAVPVLALALTFLAGRHLSAEGWIARLAHEAATSLDACRDTAELHDNLRASRRAER